MSQTVRLHPVGPAKFRKYLFEGLLTTTLIEVVLKTKTLTYMVRLLPICRLHPERKEGYTMYST